MTREQAIRQNDILSGERMELEPKLVSIMEEEIGKAKMNKVPMIRAFEAVAQRSGLKSNTIRNYYYRYIHAQGNAMENIPDNTSVEQSIQDAIGKPFNEQETRELMIEMLKAQANGESVRGCGNRLSGGDKRLLIRLQNKYRSIIARDREYVEQLIKEMNNMGIRCFNPYTKKDNKINAVETVNQEVHKQDALIDILGQFISNMKKIQQVDLYSFLKGLKDLTSMASGHHLRQQQDRDISAKEQQIQALNNQIILSEARAEKDKKEISTLRARLQNLTMMNRLFIALPDEDKLSALHEYIDQLKSYLKAE